MLIECAGRIGHCSAFGTNDTPRTLWSQLDATMKKPAFAQHKAINFTCVSYKKEKTHVVPLTDACGETEPIDEALCMDIVKKHDFTAFVGS